jgi:hypothetical protein
MNREHSGRRSYNGEKKDIASECSWSHAEIESTLSMKAEAKAANTK